MFRFEAVASVNEITVSEGWVESTKFNSRYEIVYREDKATHEGRCYRLIAKHERCFSGLERLGRGFLGTLAAICSLGFALLSKDIRALFIKNHESRRFGVPFSMDMTPLSDDTKGDILSFLDGASLASCQRVSKDWQRIASADYLWKNLPRPRMTFGKKEWERYFEDVGEEPPLPINIHKILNSPSPVCPDKKVEETHRLFLFPEAVDEKSFVSKCLAGDLELYKVSGEIFYLKDEARILDGTGDNPVPKAHWVLMGEELFSKGHLRIIVASVVF